MTALHVDPAEVPRRWEASRAPREGPVVVLGCRPLWSEDGRLGGALGRRVEAARQELLAGGRSLIVSGGRTWGGVVEADAMREELLRAGVPSSQVVRERCSLTTRDNARLTASILRRFEPGVVTLVTCEWHMRRAAALFRREGLVVAPLAVPSPPAAPLARCYRAGHEWVSATLDVGWGSTT